MLMDGCSLQNNSLFDMEKFEYRDEESVPFETKYPCIICIQRVKMPVICARCKSILCFNHVKKISNKCPYCRLQPFTFQREHFLDQIVQHDKKKEQQYMISNSEFKCLVQGCDFAGKYHKMDLHRRKFHRNETLRQIIFPQEREKAKKLKAVAILLNRFKQNKQQNEKAYQIGLILQARSKNKIQLNKMIQMIRHIEHCRHADCQKIHIEQTMCFIGSKNKQISGCIQSQQFLTFY